MNQQFNKIRSNMQLFVQWGISAIPGGVWRANNYFGITEWLWKRMRRTRQSSARARSAIPI